jgi:hypothetical protein
MPLLLGGEQGLAYLLVNFYKISLYAPLCVFLDRKQTPTSLQVVTHKSGFVCIKG